VTFWIPFLLASPFVSHLHQVEKRERKRIQKIKTICLEALATLGFFKVNDKVAVQSGKGFVRGIIFFAFTTYGHLVTLKPSVAAS